MTFDIPLYNSGPAGLGVTVYGRTSLSSTAKRSGDMGIYIKSIVPGGAAALVSVCVCVCVCNCYNTAYSVPS